MTDWLLVQLTQVRESEYYGLECWKSEYIKRAIVYISNIYSKEKYAQIIELFYGFLYIKTEAQIDLLVSSLYLWMFVISDR